MRVFVCILLIVIVVISCVKKPSTSPIPSIQFVDFKAWKSNGIDTAVLVIGYEDGDGDIFRDNTANGPNLIGTFYYLNSVTHKFTGIKDFITNDTAHITQTVVQPVDASYKGKSVKGEITLPWSPFRSGDSVKVFKYTIFVVDEKGHKSNIVTTPQFTVAF
jgi:hypothetical protein